MESYSESDPEETRTARGRVKRLMKEIHSRRDQLTTDEEVAKMADRCTEMLVSMVDRAKPTKPSRGGGEEMEGAGGGGSSGRGRPDFKKIYKERLGRLMETNKQSQRQQKTEEESSEGNSSTEESSSMASDCSQSSNESLPDIEEIGAGDGEGQGKRDYDAIRRKAEEWLTKHQGDLSALSSEDEIIPKLPNLLRAPLKPPTSTKTPNAFGSSKIRPTPFKPTTSTAATPRASSKKKKTVDFSFSSDKKPTRKV